jgi:hypothetical protein
LLFRAHPKTKIFGFALSAIRIQLSVKDLNNKGFADG